MRRVSFFLLISTLFWVGCVGNSSLGTSAIAQRNIENMARLSIGMTESQVFRIMRKPYRNEAIQIEDNSYEVWFYITKPTVLTQTEMAHINLTPLTFKNGTLRSLGYDYYNSITRKESFETKEEKPVEIENHELEKALQAPQKQKTPVAPEKSPAVQPQPKQPPAPVQPTPPQNPAASPPAPKKETNPPVDQKKGKPATPAKGQVSVSKQPTTPAKSSVDQPKQTPAPKKEANPPVDQKKGKPATPAKGQVSMAKKPVTEEADAEERPEPKKKVPLTKEDEDMINQEQEENFDFW